MEDADGGYIMAGDTHLGETATGKVLHGGLVIKTDTDGEILWQYILGDEHYEQVSFNSGIVLPGDGYILVGRITRNGERFSDILRVELTPD
jgi:hypothetical protein